MGWLVVHASGTPRLLRCHRQWVSFIGSIAPYKPLQRSLCLLYSQVFVYKEIGNENMLLNIDYNSKKTTNTHCSVPMFKRPSNETAPPR